MKLTFGREVATDFPVEVSLDAVTQTFVIFGKRGSGKSNAGVVIAEEMCKAHAPWAALDPVGHWWGLRSRPDGSPGFKVLVFGGPHSDLPLEHTAGALMADVLCDTRVQMVLCTVLFSGKERAQFVTAFAERLLSRVLADPFALHVFLEEADSFAPQRPMAGEERMLGAVDKLMRRGRQGGLGMTAITQRSAKINKDITTQAETLLAFRTLGPQDRNAIDEWVKFHDSGEQRQQLLSSLSSLSDGESWMWSPEWLDFFGRVQWRRRETFDAASTPKVGERKVSPTLADVDLEQLRVRMAQTIERAKADDPKTLRARIAQLERERAEEHAHPLQQLKEVTVMVPILSAMAIEDLRGIVDRADSKAHELLEAAHRLMDAAKTLNLAIAHVDEAMGKPKLPKRSNTIQGRDYVITDTTMNGASHEDTGPLNQPRQKILDTLGRLASVRINEPLRNHVAFFAGVSPNSSGFEKNLGILRRDGYISYPVPGRIALTRLGADCVAVFGDPPTSEELQAQICQLVSFPQAAILRILIAAYPEAIPRAELAERSGQSKTSSGFEKNVGCLRALGFLDYPEPGMVAAEPALFVEQPVGATR